MKGILVTCLSKDDREKFLKDFFLSMKKAKTKENSFIFSDDGDCIECIEIPDHNQGAVSVSMVMIKDHVSIKISGMGTTVLEPVELPEGAFAVINARM